MIYKNCSKCSLVQIKGKFICWKTEVEEGATFLFPEVFYCDFKDGSSEFETNFGHSTTRQLEL